MTTLFKLSANSGGSNAGARRAIWRAYQEPGSPNVICVEWGLEHGTMQKVTRTVHAGKQGRSLQEQVDFEIASLAHKKRSKNGYVDEHIAVVESPPPLPMLALPWNRPKMFLDSSEQKYFIQPKLDGLRCIADLHTGILYSRSRKPFTSLPHITKRVLELRDQAHGGNVRYLDGEIYSHGMNFQQITSLARRKAMFNGEGEEEEEHLQLHVFDCLHQTLNFECRWQLLRALFNEQKEEAQQAVKLCDTKQVSTLTPDFDLVAMHEYLALGYEGVMIRTSSQGPAQGYAPGMRSKLLCKLKNFDQEEFPILQFQKHAELETLGSILVSLNTGKTFSATPANTAEFKSKLWKNRAQYESGEYVATVKFQGVSTDGIPRFPVLIGLRHRDDC